MAGLLTANETASITSVVQSSLDVTLPRYARSVAKDAYGHDIESYPGYPSTPTSSFACNVISPTATELQTYAGIIGSKRALKLRVMSTTTMNEGDGTQYDGVFWRVQALMDAASYSVTQHYLITTIV